MDAGAKRPGLAGGTMFGLGALLSVPLLLGVRLFEKHGYGANLLAFLPGSLPKMLVSDHRGLFVWTPLTLLALIGYVRLLHAAEGRPAVPGHLGGLDEWRPRPVLAAAGVATAWSLFLGLNVGLPFGGYGFDTGNASQLAGRVLDGRMTPGQFAYGIWHGSPLRGIADRL